MNKHDVDNLKKFESWMQQGQGAHLYECEQQGCLNLMKIHAPQYVLQLAGFPLLNYGVSNICHYIHVDPMLSCVAEGHTVVANLSQLPFASHTLDCVICAHIHEVYGDAHTYLEEAIRALKPGGMLYLFGFNMHGYYWFANIFDRDYFPWQHQWYSMMKLKKLLQQMDCHCVSVDYLSTALLHQQTMWCRLRSKVAHCLRRSFPAMGSVYVMGFVKLEQGRMPSGLAKVCL